MNLSFESRQKTSTPFSRRSSSRWPTAEDMLALAAEFGANDVAYAVPRSSTNSMAQGIPAGLVGILGFSAFIRERGDRIDLSQRW
jgi:hypothetical protein